MEAGRPSAWASILRSALLFAPFLVVNLGVLGLLVQQIATEGASGGRIVAVVLVSFVAMLIGYQVLQSVRDLFSGLIETTGVVERRWNRSDLFLFRNTYIFVERNVFRLAPKEAIDVQLGDTVRVVHFPHTSTVERIEVVSTGDAEGRPANGG